MPGWLSGVLTDPGSLQAHRDGQWSLSYWDSEEATIVLCLQGILLYTQFPHGNDGLQRAAL